MVHFNSRLGEAKGPQSSAPSDFQAFMCPACLFMKIPFFEPRMLVLVVMMMMIMMMIRQREKYTQNADFAVFLPCVLT
jgi:hypothetical protein